MNRLESGWQINHKQAKDHSYRYNLTVISLTLTLYYYMSYDMQAFNTFQLYQDLS